MVRRRGVGEGDDGSGGRTTNLARSASCCATCLASTAAVYSLPKVSCRERWKVAGSEEDERRRVLQRCKLLRREFGRSWACEWAGRGAIHACVMDTSSRTMLNCAARFVRMRRMSLDTISR